MNLKAPQGSHCGGYEICRKSDPPQAENLASKTFFCHGVLRCTSRGYERRLDDVIPTGQSKRGYERRIDDVIPTEQRKRGYERRIDDVIPTEQRERGYERQIDDVIPTEQRKRGYERQIDDVIPTEQSKLLPVSRTISSFYAQFYRSIFIGYSPVSI